MRTNWISYFISKGFNNFDSILICLISWRLRFELTLHTRWQLYFYLWLQVDFIVFWIFTRLTRLHLDDLCPLRCKGSLSLRANSYCGLVSKPHATTSMLELKCGSSWNVYSWRPSMDHGHWKGRYRVAQIGTKKI